MSHGMAFLKMVDWNRDSHQLVGGAGNQGQRPNFKQLLQLAKANFRSGNGPMFRDALPLAHIQPFFGGKSGESQKEGKQTMRSSFQLPQLNLGWGQKKDSDKDKFSAERQAEYQQRAFASALASGKPATVLSFYSPTCQLCKSLLGVVGKLRRRHMDWLTVVEIDVGNNQWLPEVGHYDVTYVPCFVLIDSRGRALAKTSVPYTRQHVIKGLSYLVESMQPVQFSSRHRHRRVEDASAHSSP